MRHRVYGKHLGRDKNERNALFKNLVQSLLIHGSIETTDSKAKAVKGLVDKIITQAKSKESQRLLQTFLIDKNTREKLIKEIAPELKDRTSGYTSVVRVGQRLGDGAMMVRMSLLTSGKKSLPSKEIEKLEDAKEEPVKVETKIEKKAAIKKVAKKVAKK